MNTTKEIAVVMTVLMVAAAMAAPAAMGAMEYSASVVAANVVVNYGAGGGAFGKMLAGDTKELVDSLNLTNLGGASADVDAKFTTNVSGFYGLKSSANVLGASNFSLGKALEFLYDNGTYKPLGLSNRVANESTVFYNASLTVPGGQVPGTYTGNVQLRFTSVLP